MSTVLIVGIILVVTLVGVSLLQWVLRRRQLRLERALPQVEEMARLVLEPSDFPASFHLDYRGPLTNERLAQEAPDEEAALEALDEVGRVIGYRQAFRDPRSYSEIVDILLNWTLRRDAQHRQLTVDLSLYEDAGGGGEAVDEPPPAAEDEGAEEPSSIRVTEIREHGLAFARSVRQWSRLDARGQETQRKVEVRWQAARLGCLVSGDSEPPGGIAAEEVYRLARLVQGRVAAGDAVGAP